MPTATATMESVNLSLTHTPKLHARDDSKADAVWRGTVPDLEQNPLHGWMVSPTNEAITFWALQGREGHPKKPHHVRPERWA